MEHHEVTFEALPPEKFKKKKNRKILLFAFLLLFAVAYLVLGIITADTMKWIGGVIFMCTYGMLLWDNYHIKPVKVKLSAAGIWMQQPESALKIGWHEVKNAVYNGRYLDLFIQSSIRETLDLKPFEEQVQAEILKQVEGYISTQGLSIKYMGVKKEPVLA